MSVQTQKDYKLELDVIRVLALFGVVSIHVLNPIYARPDFFGGTFWWVTFLLNALFRVSVPLFIMLSGYLLLDKQVTFTQNWQRLRNRLLIPLISWYLILEIYSDAAAYAWRRPLNVLESITGLASTTNSHLYFLVGLAFLYFLIPILQPFLQQAEKRTIALTTAIFMANGVLATLSKYLVFRNDTVFSTFTLGFMWLGYFLLGYCIKKNWLRYKAIHLVLLASLSYIVTVGLAYIFWQQHHQGNDLFFMGFQSYAEEFLSLNVVGMSVPIFILLERSSFSAIRNSAMFQKVLLFLASISFGVYLSHVSVLDYLHKFVGVSVDNPALSFIPLYLLTSGIATLAISIGITMLFKKIKFLRTTLGEQ